MNKQEKHKILKMENEIKECFALKNISDEKRIKIKNFINGVKMKDLFDGTSHFEVINCIYFNKRTSRLRFDAQANCLHIDVRTLYNYRIKYIEFFNKLSSFSYIKKTK